MCFPHEASEQSNGVCMIVIPFLDILLLIVNTVVAFLNRGTIWGWLATGFVLYQVFVLVKFVKQT